MRASLPMLHRLAVVCLASSLALTLRADESRDRPADDQDHVGQGEPAREARAQADDKGDGREGHQDADDAARSRRQARKQRSGSGGNDDPDHEAPRSSADTGPGNDAQGKDGRGPAKPDKADRDRAAPPPRVPLPPAGTYPAATIVRALEKLTDRPVVFAHSDLGKRPVTIRLSVSRRESTAEDVRILLGAHGLFVHDHFLPDPHRELKPLPAKEGKADGEPPEPADSSGLRGQRVWIVSADPNWRARADRRFSRIFTVSPDRFRKSVDNLSRYVASLPRTPEDRPDLETVMIPVWRAGKIIVRTPSTRVLRVMEKLVDGGAVSGDDEGADGETTEDEGAQQRLLSYVPRHYPAIELRERVLGYLGDEEARQAHIVPSGVRNLLLVRARPKLLEKIRKVLPFADNPRLDPDRAEEAPQKKEEPAEDVPQRSPSRGSPSEKAADGRSS